MWEPLVIGLLYLGIIYETIALIAQALVLSLDNTSWSVEPEKQKTNTHIVIHRSLTAAATLL